MTDLVEVELNRVAAAIRVPDHRNPRADGRRDAQFFFQLPAQRVLEFLIGLDLSAGKFPLEGHGLVSGALADQDLLLPHNQRGHNLFYFHLRHRRWECGK